MVGRLQKTEECDGLQYKWSSVRPVGSGMLGCHFGRDDRQAVKMQGVAAFKKWIKGDSGEEPHLMKHTDS